VSCLHRLARLATVIFDESVALDIHCKLQIFVVLELWSMDGPAKSNKQGSKRILSHSINALKVCDTIQGQ
jgi:hypothetical protein